MERVWDGWHYVQEEAGGWKISYWGHGEKGNNLSSVRKWQGICAQWPLPKERLWNGNLQISLTSQSGTNRQHFGPLHTWWQLSVLGEHNPGHPQHPSVWWTWGTCLLKDLSFACSTPMYLFQGRAASFKLPGKIKLYYSVNMTRGWQAPVESRVVHSQAELGTCSCSRPGRSHRSESPALQHRDERAGINFSSLM